MNADVAIIILNWNNPFLTQNAVRTIAFPKHIRGKILIVDNGSVDNSVAILSKLKNCDLLVLEKNYGFAKGNNIAYEYIREKYNPEYILLLNNDVEVDGNFISELFKHKNIAEILTPKIFYYNSKTIWSCGGIINKMKMRAENIGEGRKENDLNKINVGECDFATGCALWIKASILSSINLFDENLFCYYEDVDFSLRAKSFGYKIKYVPSAIVYHFSGASSGDNRDSKKKSFMADLLNIRNRIIITNKYYRERYLFLGYSVILTTVMRYLYGKIKQGNLLLRMLWLGLKDNKLILAEYSTDKIYKMINAKKY